MQHGWPRAPHLVRCTAGLVGPAQAQVMGAREGGGHGAEAKNWMGATAAALSELLPTSRAQKMCFPVRKTLSGKVCGLVHGSHFESAMQRTQRGERARVWASAWATHHSRRHMWVPPHLPAGPTT